MEPLCVDAAVSDEAAIEDLPDDEAAIVLDERTVDIERDEADIGFDARGRGGREGTRHHG